MERLQNLSPEQMDKLLDNLIQKMVDEGQITIEEPSDQQAHAPGVGNGPDTQGEVRSHRQVARLPGLQDAEGSARLARQIAASAATIRATWPPASRPPARPSSTSSATR